MYKPVCRQNIPCVLLHGRMPGNTPCGSMGTLEGAALDPRLGLPFVEPPRGLLHQLFLLLVRRRPAEIHYLNCKLI